MKSWINKKFLASLEEISI